jgi:hypothetical protein
MNAKRRMERPRDAAGRDRARAQPGDRLAVENDAAGARRVDPGDQVEHRRLARTVGSDHRDDRTGFDRKIEPVDGDEPAEALGHAFERQQRHQRTASV